MIEARVLGPVELRVGDAPAPAELLWRKHLGLIVYLACSPERTRSREHLVGLFWGDKPESAARHSLNEALRLVRRHAGADAVESVGDRVRLATEAVRLDTERFEVCVEAGDREGAGRLIAGVFLEGFYIPDASEFENWLSAERLAWRRKSVDALVGMGEERLSAGDLEAAVAAAERALSLDATSEQTLGLALRGLALRGDRGAALERYAEFAARLEEEIGIEPGEPTRELVERIRRERAFRLPEQVTVAPVAGGESRRAPLLGRERELARLIAVWSDCRGSGRAALAIVAGDPGTGKTRMLEELAGRARLDGAVVASVRCVEADHEGVSFGVISGLLRAGLEEGATVETSPALALPAALRIAAARAPTVLCVDDAHWADRDSLLALGSVLRDLEELPVLLLLAVSGYPQRAEIDDLRARIGRDIRGTSVSLPPLSADSLRALARWALPGYSEVQIERLARRLATDTAGLPLLAVELVHAVALGLDLDRSAGAWPAPSRTLDQTLPSELPDAVVAAIRVGFRRLTPHARDVLAAIAVLGERVDAGTLARATGRDAKTEAEADDLTAALDELEWLRWISAETRGYSVVARIVQQVVAEDMITSAQRRRILEAAQDGA